MKNFYIRQIKPVLMNCLITLKWVVFALLTGTIVGLVSSAFYFLLTLVNDVRQDNSWIIYLLP
ncbi:MAG: hypothetical protein IJ419_10395, partial [Agathobacter sp.]|nr:hypothetical protein [Agathobacter sp.]